MAVPPKFAGTIIDFGASPPASSSKVPHTTHTLEFYLDYCCPFSAKIFNTLTETVVPLVEANDKWASSLRFVFRQQIQPWHPSSTLMHETGLAVLQLAPERFIDFSIALFRAQKDFMDANVVNETRNATYKRLAKIAGQVGLDESEVYKRLEISDKPDANGGVNVGNAVTSDAKLITKMNRLVGIHVTPTAVLDGVVQDVSSGWGKQEWEEYLSKNVG